MARVGFNPFRTYTDAVHDAVTAEYTECIAQTVEAAVSLGITAIDRETYAANKPAGPINLSGFHQNGPKVEQHAQKYIHTTRRVFALLWHL